MSKPDFVRMARDMADEVTKRPGDGIAALAVMSEALREAYDAGLERAAAGEMMTDPNELRRLAEAALKAADGEPWWGYDDLMRSTPFYGAESAIIAAASPATVLGLLDKIDALNAAWMDDLEMSLQYLRESNEAREAVKRLAGALEELATDAEYAMRSNDEAIARDALSDPIVRRIVEGG
jgi:hypothetical protein